MTRVVSGLDCNGEEESLIDCDHDNFGDLFCPGEGLNDLAGVVCTDTQVSLSGVQPDPGLIFLFRPTSSLICTSWWPQRTWRTNRFSSCNVRWRRTAWLSRRMWNGPRTRTGRHTQEGCSGERVDIFLGGYWLLVPGSPLPSPIRAPRTSDLPFPNWPGTGMPAISITIPWRSSPTSRSWTSGDGAL